MIKTTQIKSGQCFIEFQCLTQFDSANITNIVIYHSKNMNNGHINSLKQKP